MAERDLFPKEHPAYAALDRSKNLDAEQAVLGGCFMRPEILEWLELESEAFVDARNQWVWNAMRSLSRDGVPVDELTVADVLRRAGRPELGPYVVQLQLRVPTVDNVVAYAAVLREHMVNRRLLLIGSSVASRLESGLSGEELLADIQRAVCEAEPVRVEAGKDIATVVANEARRIEDHFATEGATVGIPTGIVDLDRNTGGIPIGVPMVIGARPGEGKSTLAMNAGNHAAQRGFGVHLFTYEDREESWGQRELACWTGIDVSRIRNRDLNEADRERIAYAKLELSDRKNFVVEHAHGKSVHWLIRCVRGQRRALGTRLVVVDYLQLMPETARGQRTNERIEANMNALAELAGADNMGVVILSQLNREVTKREGGVPQLEDFRDSGSIEQVGKLILALQQQDQTRLGVWVLKNHQGPRAHFTVQYDRPRCRIR